MPLGNRYRRRSVWHCLARHVAVAANFVVDLAHDRAGPDADDAADLIAELAPEPNPAELAPAIANAYFSLTGQRVRTLPIMVGTAA